MTPDPAQPLDRHRWQWWLLGLALALPVIDLLTPESLQLAELMRPIFVFAVLGLGLNIVTGLNGVLHLGSAAFMAIGAYTYAILTCDIYPFCWGFWPAVLVTPVIGALAGLVLGSPALRLRGDYLAIVTLGFGEIVQDILKNLDTITKGMQGINPLPGPKIPGYDFVTSNYVPWYYLYLAILVAVVILIRNLENSRLGRAWIAIREDELAATAMGIDPAKTKLLAFAAGAALCGLSGALQACLLGSTGEPGNYDFTISITALCIIIVGGMGNIMGVLIGALVIIGLDSILINKISMFLTRQGMAGTTNVLLAPTNWKFMLYGLALIVMMRYRPEGLLPSRRMRAELHHVEEASVDEEASPEPEEVL